MKTARFSFAMLLIGLALALVYHMWDGQAIKKWWSNTPEEPVFSIPEDGIKTDAWSWTTFQKLALQNPTGFVYSPLGLNIILRDLEHLTDEATSQTIAAMQLPEVEPAMDVNAPAYGFSRLVMDDGIPTTEHEQAKGVLQLPLLQDRARALESLHIQMVQSIKNAFDYPIMTSMVSRQAQLMGFTLINQPTPWLYPIYQDEGDYIDFTTNTSGSLMLDAIYMQAPLRSIKTPEYDAYMLVLKGDAESSRSSCMLIIMPKLDELDTFIKWLSVAEINRIKEALLSQESVPECQLKLPAFQAIAQSMSMRLLLEKMGLASLFQQGEQFSGLTEQSIKLEELWHSANIELKAEPKPILYEWGQKECPIMHQIDRPFIWMIGEPTQGTCPSMMGSVQTL